MSNIRIVLQIRRSPHHKWLGLDKLAESGIKRCQWSMLNFTAKDARNVTYHDWIKAPQHYFVLGQPKSLSSGNQLQGKPITQ